MLNLNYQLFSIQTTSLVVFYHQWYADLANIIYWLNLSI